MTAPTPVCEGLTIIGQGHAILGLVRNERQDGKYSARFIQEYQPKNIDPKPGWQYSRSVFVVTRHEVVQRWDYGKGSVVISSDEFYASISYGSSITLETNIYTQKAPDGTEYLSYLEEVSCAPYVIFTREGGPYVLLITCYVGGGHTSPKTQTLEGNPGERVSFSISATPDAFYKFDHWTSSVYGDLEDPSNPSTTVSGTVPESGMTLILATAYFKYNGYPKPPYNPPDPDPPGPQPGTKHTVTIAADPESGGVVFGGGEYDDKEMCSLEADRNIGYELMRLVNETDGVTFYPHNPPQCFGKTIEHTFEVTKDTSWVAYFRECTNKILRGSSGNILRGESGNILRDY